jgi:hypothetical protein
MVGLAIQVAWGLIQYKTSALSTSQPQSLAANTLGMIQRMNLHMPTVSNRSSATIGADTAPFVGRGMPIFCVSPVSIIRISQGR